MITTVVREMTAINSVDFVAGNDAIFGDLGTDVCDADAGDTVVSCP